MELGIVGLGKMGSGIAARLLERGHQVVGCDVDPGAVDRLVAEGGTGVADLEELVTTLTPPRAVWAIVPAGLALESVLDGLLPHLTAGDILLDGGNSYYKESQKRALRCGGQRVHFVDVGISGGISGRESGYCLMVGGEVEVVNRLVPLFEALAAAGRGWGHVGPSGAGHFVKMVHNGIEYGLMQAYAEGFALLRRKEDFALDLAQVADLWCQGSVIRSWLLELTASTLEENPSLDGIEPSVADSGEGRWAVAEAIELGAPLPVIAQALFERFGSRDEGSYSHRLLAALRHRFGGHGTGQKDPQ